MAFGLGGEWISIDINRLVEGCGHWDNTYYCSINVFPSVSVQAIGISLFYGRSVTFDPLNSRIGVSPYTACPSPPLRIYGVPNTDKDYWHRIFTSLHPN